jgi:L-ribulokinase
MAQTPITDKNNQQHKYANMSGKYTIGLDYGTDSVRSLIVDVSNGKEVASEVFYYPRWKAGKYCNPSLNQFRQHPLDYVEGLEYTIKKALEKAPKGTAEGVVAIAVDTTGSTPVAVDAHGTPLAMVPGFEENPNAMFVLWKDHTAVNEAELINRVARTWGGIDYTKYEGGIYSTEWFWAKILHVLRSDAQVREAAFSWVEHCDWIPAMLTGITDPLKLKRSRCAAGHKAMWHPEWNGLPSEEFLTKLDPLLGGLRKRMFTDTYTSDVPMGTISREWALRLGISENVVIGVGAFDAHLGAIGAEIKPYYLSKVMGTSTCDMLMAPLSDVGKRTVKGICGQVDGSIIPGMMGLEAGQSAFGDVYAWFKNVLLWPAEQLLAKTTLVDAATREKLVEEMTDKLISELSVAAGKIPAGENSIIALDWLNGRRTPDANQTLKGAITGLTLGSDAPQIFRALVEATAFGARKIVDRFIDEGVKIEGVIALGGVARKSPFIMQIIADVLGMPIKIASSDQACALGAAMAASVAGGIYSNFDEAQQKMGGGFEREYLPNMTNNSIYNKMYEKYGKLGKFVETGY